MNSVFRLDDRNCLDRDLGCVPGFEDHVGMRINEISAVRAAQKRTWIHDIGVTEDMAGIELFLKITLASWTVKSLVEILESVRFGSQNILMPLDGCENQSRIHFLENSHRHNVNVLGS